MARPMAIATRAIDRIPCSMLRFARLLRFVRIAAVVRTFLVGRDVGAETRGARAGWLLGPTLLIFWAASAYGFWLVEHGGNPAVKNFGDSLYLSFLTATTLGYGEVRPVTPEGRIIAGLVIFAAIGLVGFASSQLTLLWLGQEGGRISAQDSSVLGSEGATQHARADPQPCAP